MCRRWLVVWFAVWSGCTGVIDEHHPGAASGGADGAPGSPDAGVTSRPDGGPGDASTAADATPGGGRTVAQTCARWRADRADIREGAWTGDVATCAAGDVDSPGRDNAVRLINLYRWLADLPPVAHDPDLDSRAQACALMMRANNALSHQPPDTWACYTADGAAAAGRSNISSGPGVRSIDAYMNDWSSPTSRGHRRWILSAGLGRVGVGSTDRHSCLWVINGFGGGGGAWTAFPPPGPFPVDAARSFGYTLDGSGWSIQSNSIRLADATIEISHNGTALPTTVTALASGYGSSYAVSMVPDGWIMEAGKTYRVSVTGIASPFAYDVQVVDCAN